VLGFAGLAVCLTLTIANFPTLIGGSTGLAAAIGAVLAVIALAGVVVALVRPGSPGDLAVPAPRDSPSSETPSAAPTTGV